MGRHSKSENRNVRPWDASASPAKKANEFDTQFAQNQAKPQPPRVEVQVKGAPPKEKKGKHAK